jgi:hypothetical protein
MSMVVLFQTKGIFQKTQQKYASRLLFVVRERIIESGEKDGFMFVEVAEF